MRIYLYLLDTLSDWEIGYITAEINTGRFFKNKSDQSPIIKVSHSMNSIKTMGKIEICPDISIENVEFQEGDMLILPGADTWMDGKNEKILNIIEKLLDNKIVVAAICGATMALAGKGILNNRKHTSNDKEYLKISCPNYSGSELYINEPAVVDGNLITATGIAPLEFSYCIFKKSGLFKEETIEAWYNLFKTQEAKYFYNLMSSLE
ncbi:MAG: type 1 glutamine amidotransferase family protein [Candidatus Wallbacteria bacterium]